MRGGGEARAGLPASTVGPLTTKLDALSANMRVVYQTLGEVRREWRLLSEGGDIGDNAAKVLIFAVVGELRSAKQLLDEASGEAAAAKAQINLLYGVLNRQMESDQHEINFQSGLAETLERQIGGLNQELTNIRNSLDGWEGFGKGLGIVFSFGFYDPIGEAREKTRRAIATAEGQRLQAQRAKTQAEQRRREVVECRTAVENLRGLDSTITGIANDVSEGLREATSAYDTSVKAVERDGSALAGIYVGLAAKRIGDVVRWVERPNAFA